MHMQMKLGPFGNRKSKREKGNGSTFVFFFLSPPSLRLNMEVSERVPSPEGSQLRQQVHVLRNGPGGQVSNVHFSFSCEIGGREG